MYENIEEKLKQSGMELNKDLKLSGIYKQFTNLQEDSISDRYREFIIRSREFGFNEIEQIVPCIDVPFGKSSAQAHADNANDAESAQQLLQAHPATTWGYYLPLSKELSTLGPVASLNSQYLMSKRRSEHRLSFIWGAVHALLGNDIANKSVLDIACNWGGFSIEASLRGAKNVMGFDIRQENIRKAHEVTRHFGVKNAEYAVQDIFDFETKDKFDVVLNLGLMYHISKPFEMMKKTYEVTGDFAVIDTVVHREPFSGFILGTGEHAPEHAATAIGVELHPTYRALIDLAYLVGFRNVIEIKGVPADDWPDFESDPYGNGTRRCIVAFR